MKRSVFFLLVLLISMLSFSADSVDESNTESRMNSELAQRVASAEPDEMLPIYINFKERLGLADFSVELEHMGRKIRNKTVVERLKSHASSKQSRVRSYLRDLESAGSVARVEYIWAINVVALKAKPEIVLELSTRFGEIDSIKLDTKQADELSLDDHGIAKRNMQKGTHMEGSGVPQPGVTLINAPLVWAEGDSGQGVLVANIDTGTDWDHPDLVNQIWNNRGEDVDGDGRTIEWNGSNWVFDPGDINGIDDDGNGRIDDFIGWDFTSNDNDPNDFDGHGTQTAGQVAGDGTNGTETGVAPAAQIMAIRIGGTSQSTWWAAYQYALENGCDITTSSFSYKWESNPDYENFRAITDIELAGGLVHTNSIGNQGADSDEGCDNSFPVPYNIAAPGNSPSAWMLHPDQDPLMGGMSSVIACGNVDALSDVIQGSSGMGPAAWENIQDYCPSFPYDNPEDYQDYGWSRYAPLEADSVGLLKPDVSAPGASTISTVPGGGYDTFGGTSSATPHVAGTAALLLSANPDLEPVDISRILQQTAIDYGDPGKDPRYGAGRIDAYAAYQRVLAELEGLEIPSRPQNLQIYSDFNTPSTINLTWMDPTNLDNGDTLMVADYMIEIERDGEFLTSIAGGEGAFADESVVDGEFYDYTIYTRYLVNDSTSARLGAGWIAGGAAEPSAPANLVCVSDSPMVMLSWTDPQTQIDGTPLDDLDSLLVWRDDYLVAKVAPGIQSFVDDPNELQVYTYTITAVDNESPQNESDKSNAIDCEGGHGKVFVEDFQIDIPNNDSTGVTTTLVIAEEGMPIFDVDFYFSAIHPNIGDLVLTLTSPEGTQVVVMDRPGFPDSPLGNNGNDPQIILDDEAEIDIEDIDFDGTAEVVGTFRPSPNMMAAFDGETFTGEWTLTVQDLFSGFPGSILEWGLIILDEELTDINDNKTPSIPETFALGQNYPNPFNPTTRIKYALPESSEVWLTIYDVNGRKIQTLVAGTRQAAANYTVEWDGRNAAGINVGSGVYFYRLFVGDRFQATKKMLLVR